jgi:cytoskeletal protein CcmA (bactofilin family)
MAKPMGDLETIIGPGVKLEGNFSGEGNIVIKGQVKGNLSTKSDLRIDEGASVELKSDSSARNLFLAGELRGNIRVEEKAILATSAQLLGDLACKILSVQEGATFKGRCATGGEKLSPETSEEE